MDRISYLKTLNGYKTYEKKIDKKIYEKKEIVYSETLDDDDDLENIVGYLDNDNKIIIELDDASYTLYYEDKNNNKLSDCLEIITI